MLSKPLLAISVLLAALVGCCPKQVTPSGQWTGKVEQVAGLTAPPYKDDELLRIAIGLPGKGGLANGEVFVVEKPVTVYRVWNRVKKESQMGRWWTFETPKGPLQDWQAKYGVCPEWGPRDVVSKCRLKIGSKIAVGPGQSMDCENGTFGPSPANQVYVPNHLVNSDDLVDNCEPDAAWP